MAQPRKSTKRLELKADADLFAWLESQVSDRAGNVQQVAIALLRKAKEREELLSYAAKLAGTPIKDVEKDDVLRIALKVTANASKWADAQNELLEAIKTLK